MAVVERAGEGVAPEGGGAVLLPLQHRQQLAAHLVGLRGVEARAAHDVGEHAEQGVGVAREPGHGDAQRVPARAGVEAGPEVVHHLRQLEGVPPAGAASHQLRGEGRQPGLAEALLGDAAAHQHAERELRQPVVLEDEDAEPVRQLGAVQARGVDDGPAADRRRRQLPGGLREERAAALQEGEAQHRDRTRCTH